MEKEIHITEDEIRDIELLLNDAVSFCQSDDKDNAIDCIERAWNELKQLRSH